MKQIWAVYGSEAAPEVLGVLPQDIDAIEFRTVGRQAVAMQSLSGPPPPVFFDVLAIVNRGVVEQDNARHRMRLVRYLIKKRSHPHA